MKTTIYSKENLRARGSDRIQVNNLLSAICIGALFFLLSTSNQRINEWTTIQLSVAIPLLITSSLAYAKTCYRDFQEFRKWDILGWLTHSIGYLFILNAIFVLLYQSKYLFSAWLFIGSVLLLFVVYSVTDVLAKKSRWNEKLLKLILYFSIIFFGSILPMLSGWV